MKPLAARACARPLTAPSTMALLEQPNHARCAIQLPDPPFSTERARSRSSAGYRPATLSLDSLVGSLAARPIASLGPSRNIETVSTRRVRAPGNGCQNRGLLFEVSSQRYPVRTPL